MEENFSRETFPLTEVTPASKDDSDCEFVGELSQTSDPCYPRRRRKRRGVGDLDLETIVNEMLDGFDADSVPLAALVSEEVDRDRRRRNDDLPVIDTIDLSTVQFKPTPPIHDVIVIDSDTSTLQTSPVRERSPPRLVAPRECPICFQGFSSERSIVSTFCGHLFCKPCMKTVMRTLKHCPTCRRKLKGKGYHSLFL